MQGLLPDASVDAEGEKETTLSEKRKHADNVIENQPQSPRSSPKRLGRLHHRRTPSGRDETVEVVVSKQDKHTKVKGHRNIHIVSYLEGTRTKIKVASNVDFDSFMATIGTTHSIDPGCCSFMYDDRDGQRVHVAEEDSFSAFLLEALRHKENCKAMDIWVLAGVF